MVRVLVLENSFLRLSSGRPIRRRRSTARDRFECTRKAKENRRENERDTEPQRNWRLRWLSGKDAQLSSGTGSQSRKRRIEFPAICPSVFRMKSRTREGPGNGQKRTIEFKNRKRFRFLKVKEPRHTLSRSDVKISGSCRHTYGYRRIYVWTYKRTFSMGSSSRWRRD